MGEYHDIIYDQTNNKERNQIIASKVEEAVSEGRKVLVLTKRIAHYEYILEALHDKGIDDTFAIRSSDPNKKSNALIRSLRDSSTAFNCILGTYTMLGTGFDLSQLDTIILAGDLKSSVLQTQAIGRILSKNKNKKYPKVIDIKDTNNPILLNQARIRTKFYEENNWKFV